MCSVVMTQRGSDCGAAFDSSAAFDGSATPEAATNRLPAAGASPPPAAAAGPATPLAAALESLQLEGSSLGTDAASACPWREEAAAVGAAVARKFKADSIDSLGSLASYASAFDDSEPTTPRSAAADVSPQVAAAAHAAAKGAPTADRNADGSLGLTPEEIVRAQAMWSWLSQENWPAQVTSALTEVGVALFTNLFRISPRLLDLFPFKDENGQPQKEALEAHALLVMRTLGAAIASLHDIPLLIGYLKELTLRHIQYGVKLEHYQILAAALMATLEGAFGKNWCAEDEAVWLRVFELVMHAAKSSYAAAADAAPGEPLSPHATAAAPEQ